MINVYYEKPSTDSYVRYSLAGSKHFLLVNDSLANTIDFSHDGVSKIGKVNANESLEFDCMNKKEETVDVWIKSSVAGAAVNFRLWGW